MSDEKPQSDVWQATAPTPKGFQSDVPSDLVDLFEYLNAKKYLNFENQEPAAHPSRGPHTKFGLPVRVFYNDKISASILAGNNQHPAGSAIVKEMFDTKNQLAGWAVTVKTSEQSDDGKGWFWYEVTSVTDSTAIAASGNGVPGCSSCHAIGNDMVLSDTHVLK
jgi:hypothetical protein